MSFGLGDRPARRAASWLAPSAVAACAGALAAGGIELLGDGETGGAFGAAAAVGFLALLGAPGLFLASLVARAVVAAWGPRRLAERLIEAGGGAPLLAGWAIVIWLALLGLAGALFQGIWMLAAQTAWMPMTVALAVPMIAVALVIAMLAFAWPAARAIAWVLRRVDGRWQRAGRRSLLTPWWIAGWTVVATVGALAAMWILVVAKRVGPFDLWLLVPPVAAVVVTLAAHLGWRAAPRRARAGIGGVAGGLAVAAVACALVAARTAPNLTLTIWGDRPIAGQVIDLVYDLDEVRADVSLAELAPTIPRPGAPHPDIILVTIDTVRADHTPPYQGRAEMPGLEHLGKIGAVFEWAFSPSNVTRRSVPSIVLGLQPNRVHGRVVGWALRVDPRHVLLAERLQEGGYETAGFMCCEGFWGTEFHTGLQRGLGHLEIEKNGVELARRAKDWLEAREQRPNRRPLFLWMHLIEPHNWSAGPSDSLGLEDRRRLYDRALAVADSALVALLSPFSHRSPESAPIVIVTSDHGEALGEHGQPNHSTDLYDAQTHVPLVIAGPGVHPGRVTETVSLVDLVPTVLELAGFEPPRGIAIDGRSLADLVSGKRVPDPDAGEAFAAQIRDRSNPGGITTVVRGRYKLISTNGTLELFDTRADPGEHTNLISAPAHGKVAAELKALLAHREALGDVSPFP